MKEVNKHTISLEPKDEKYNYSRNTSIVLSEEFFTAKEIVKISTLAFTAAVRNNASLTTSITPIEIPEDEEEGWKVKAEKAEKTSTERYTELTAVRREKIALELRLKAILDYDGDSVETIIERLLVDEISSSWERDAVRKILVEQNVLA